MGISKTSGITDQPDALQSRVEAKLARGQRFEEIEGWIDDLGVDEEFKSALWLLAWSVRSTDEGTSVVVRGVGLGIGGG